MKTSELPSITQASTPVGPHSTAGAPRVGAPGGSSCLCWEPMGKKAGDELEACSQTEFLQSQKMASHSLWHVPQ